MKAGFSRHTQSTDRQFVTGIVLIEEHCSSNLLVGTNIFVAFGRGSFLWFSLAEYLISNPSKICHKSALRLNLTNGIGLMTGTHKLGKSPGTLQDS
jgi:hypothetical protein